MFCSRRLEPPLDPKLLDPKDEYISFVMSSALDSCLCVEEEEDEDDETTGGDEEMLRNEDEDDIGGIGWSCFNAEMIARVCCCF